MAYRLILTALFHISLLAGLTAGYAEAVISPGEILIVVNTESPDSLRLGKLYSELRRIPHDHLAQIKAPFKDSISRSEYNDLIAGPLRKIIYDLQGKGEKIRCIVTVYGVPLRISPVMRHGADQEMVRKHEGSLEEKQKDKDELEKLQKEKKDDKDISEKLNALRSEINKIQFELDQMLGNDTVAAVDSELALLLSPSYELAGWQLNPDFIPFRDRINNPNSQLLVSRLDAPGPDVVENMIRTSIEVEKTGLSGNFYLDARGLTGESEYAKFDEGIRKAAEILGKGFMPVVLDNRPELFGPDEAPSAALYCGWYSLGEYKDAFVWSKGAVGYHVASSEAASLHNPTRRYWVKSMLERGVVASVGPVTEPYLTAFPPPLFFFQLLMSGEYSLAEVFAMSNPFLSWRMILVGDPLYNPFRVKPAYPLKDPPLPPK